MQKHVPLGVIPFLVTGVILAPAVAANAAKKPHAQPGTLGTHQMAGGDAQFGRPYIYAAPFPISAPLT